MLISIIIPTYNATDTLKACLGSIVCQTYQEVEVLIMDAVSADATKEIAQQFMQQHSCIRFLQERDYGIYDAMNKGIKMAKGEWVYFMGADDAFYNENVLAQVAANISGDTDIIYGNSIWVPENIEEAGECGYYQLLNRGINHQRVFYKRALFEKLGYFNLCYPIASDYELNIRFFCTPGINKKYMDYIIANYHSGGFSSNKVDEVFWDNWKTILLRNFSAYLPKKDICNRISWYCWYNLQQNKYQKAGRIFCSIYFKTFSFSFLKHSISQVLKVLRY